MVLSERTICFAIAALTPRTGSTRVVPVAVAVGTAAEVIPAAGTTVGVDAPRAKASTSSFITRPLAPEPGTKLISMSSSRARRRTAGLAIALPGRVAWVAVDAVGATDATGVLVTRAAASVCAEPATRMAYKGA